MSDEQQESAAAKPGKESLPWPVYESETPIDADIVAAELVIARPEPRKPRIWSALLVGILTLPLAIVLFTVAFLAVMFASVDMATVRNPQAVQAWVTEFTGSRLGLFVLTLPGQLVFLAVACLAAWLSPVPFRERLNLTRGTMPLWTWPVVALATPAIGALSSLVMSLFFDEMGSHLEMLENVFRSHRGPFFLVVIALVAGLPGLSEELLFRGYVQSRLLQRLPVLVAIGLSSLLFAIAHIDPRHVLAVLPLGIWMGVVAWRAASIVPAILCHMVNNALSIIITHYSEPAGFDIDLNVPTVAILTISGLALIVSLVVLAKEPTRRNADQELARQASELPPVGPLN